MPSVKTALRNPPTKSTLKTAASRTRKTVRVNPYVARRNTFKRYAGNYDTGNNNAHNNSLEGLHPEDYVKPLESLPYSSPLRWTSIKQDPSVNRYSPDPPAERLNLDAAVKRAANLHAELELNAGREAAAYEAAAREAAAREAAAREAAALALAAREAAARTVAARSYAARGTAASTAASTAARSFLQESYASPTLRLPQLSVPSRSPWNTSTVSPLKLRTPQLSVPSRSPWNRSRVSSVVPPLDLGAPQRGHLHSENLRGRLDDLKKYLKKYNLNWSKMTPDKKRSLASTFGIHLTPFYDSFLSSMNRRGGRTMRKGQLD